MGWFNHGTGDRIMNTAAVTGDLAQRCIHNLLLRVIHHDHAFRYPLTDHGTGCNGTVGVVELDPVVVFAIDLGCIGFRHPDTGPAATEGQHQQVLRVGAVDTPLLVWCDPIQYNLFGAFAHSINYRCHGLGVDRRFVHAQTFTKVPHPGVILVELLASGQRAPWNQLMYVGVTGVVADVLILKATPGG